MYKLKKINKNLYKLESNTNLNFLKVYVPFSITKLYNKYNISIEINNNKDSEINISEINKYKDLENIISSLKNILTDEEELIDLTNYNFYFNIKNNNYKNNNLDLLRLTIKKSKNTFITKYLDINNNEKSIFDIESKKIYECQIKCNYLWINNNKNLLTLNLILIKDVK